MRKNNYFTYGILECTQCGLSDCYTFLCSSCALTDMMKKNTCDATCIDIFTFPFFCGTKMLALKYRSITQRKYNIEDTNIFRDIFVSTCCNICAIMQIAKENNLNNQPIQKNASVGAANKFFANRLCDFADDNEVLCDGLFYRSLCCKQCEIAKMYNYYAYNIDNIDYCVFVIILLGDIVTFPFNCCSIYTLLKLQSIAQAKYDIDDTNTWNDMWKIICCQSLSTYQIEREIIAHAQPKCMR